MRTVGLYTLGCKVSQYETEAVREGFIALGFEVRSIFSSCDVYVINTCTVTAESDAKCRKYVRRAVRQNPEAVVIVMGCYSQRAPMEAARIKGVSAVIGTQDKMTVPSLALDILEGRVERGYISAPSLEGASFEPMCITEAERTRAYVKIEDGCDSKCTYCAIKNARGPVRSKNPEDVIREVEALYERGTREIVLTGIETAAYGKDFNRKYGLSDLILELDSRHSCDRIRLGSLAPELIGEDFIKKVKDAKILAPHFHLSMQSGSDSVLRRMKRRYNTEMALCNIDKIREHIPRATFTTDLMVGFPGESEEDFSLTLDFVRRVGFLSAHVFAYSRREGTEAYSYDGQIPEEVKRDRSALLIDECRRVGDSVIGEIIKRDKTLSVIAEAYNGAYYTAHSDTFLEVNFKSENAALHGKEIIVTPTSYECGVVLAEIKEIKNN